MTNKHNNIDMLTKRLLRHTQMRRSLQESGIALMRVEVRKSQPGSHRHDIVELVAVAEGVLQHEVAGRQFRSAAGSVDIVPPGEAHNYSLAEGPCVIYNIVCDPAQCPAWELGGDLADWAEQIAGRRVRRPGQLHIDRGAAFWQRLEYLFTELDGADAGSLMASSAWYRLLLLDMARAASSGEVTWHGVGAQGGREDAALLALRREIDAHPERRWNLETMAQQLLVSKEQACRRFRAVYGQSPMAYVGDRRVSAAQQRLLAGASVAACAQACGFGSSTAMYQAFKVRCDCGPREWLQSRQL